MELHKLKQQEVIVPWFIYSGQTTFIKDKSDLIETLMDKDFGDGKVYDKNNIDDFENLCNDLIQTANNISNTLIKNKYADVLQVCSEAYLGAQLKSKVLKMLKVVEENNSNISTEDLFNPLRKVIETVFNKMSSLNLLPLDIINNKGWITGSSLFIANRHSEYIHEEEFIPPLIAHTFHRLLDVIQDASHNEGDLRLKVDHYVSTSKSSYIYKSCVYQVLEIIVWFKNLKDEYPNNEKNKLLWQKKENDTQINATQTEEETTHKTGKVINYNSYKGFAFFKPNDESENVFIPPHLVSEHALHEAIYEITVEIEEYQDNRTNETKIRVKKIIQ
jgi:cold shock CspA family protein